MMTGNRIGRSFAVLLAVGLLAALLFPLATRPSHADQQTISIAPGDQLAVTCTTSLSGTVQGTQSVITCAAPAPTQAPPTQAPASGPTITQIKGVQEGGTLSGKATIEAIIGGQNITSVVFKLEGAGQPALTHTEKNAPYFFLGDANGVPNGWDTTKSPNGNYMLTVTAANKAGQRATAMVHFHLTNQVPQPTATAQPTTVPVPTATPGSGGNETPVAGQPCPAWVHARYVTTGPDGKQYPTWHQPVDPEFGCRFGHEHGADPRTSKADATLPAFGYTAALMGMNEPHEGFKVFVMNQGTVADDGRVAKADYRIVFHMGTSGVGRYTQQHHSLEYDYIARDGTAREAHIYGMGDTGTAIGSACDNPRKGGRDFSTVGCNNPYEIWGFAFALKHPADPFTDAMHVRLYVSGAVAAFDPITTRDPADNTRLIYTQAYRQPSSGIDPLSPQAAYQGCAREAYNGPNYWNNAGRPSVYYSDVNGNIKPGPGIGLIRQEVSTGNSTSNELYKYRQDFCGNGIHAPN
jgi:hypothetical protein